MADQEQVLALQQHFALSEPDQAQRVTRAQAASAKSRIIAEWMKLDGRKVMEKEIEELEKKLHERWLEADENEAKKIRKQAMGYHHFWGLAKKVILEGQAADRFLTSLAEATGQESTR